MTIQSELFVSIQLIVAMLLGGFIGFEREREGKVAGVRTYAAVCMGACFFTLISVHMMDINSGSRIVSNIVVGIGFLGAGIIFKDQDTNRTTGLTTAATVWATAAVGVAIAFELYVMSLVASLVIYFLLSLHKMKWFNKWVKNRQNDGDEKRMD